MGWIAIGAGPTALAHFIELLTTDVWRGATGPQGPTGEAIQTTTASLLAAPK